MKKPTNKNNLSTSSFIKSLLRDQNVFNEVFLILETYHISWSPVTESSFYVAIKRQNGLNVRLKALNAPASSLEQTKQRDLNDTPFIKRKHKQGKKKNYY